MLKTSGRLMVILLVSCLIGVGVFWVVKTYPGAFGAGGNMGGLEGRGRPERSTQGFGPGGGASANTFPQGSQAENFQAPGNRPRGGFERGPGEGHEGGAASGRWVFGMAKNLAVIVLVTLFVGLIQKVFRLFTRKRSLRVA